MENYQVLTSAWPWASLKPPVTQEDLLLAEKLLGYALPPLLQRIYLEVGNGGFGPGYGLAPLLIPEQERKHFFRSIVHTTLQVRGPQWPETLLFLCDWGCFITSSLDVSSPEGPIVRSEYHQQHWGIESPSLSPWLRDWLDGQPLFASGYADDLSPVPFPW